MPTRPCLAGLVLLLGACPGEGTAPGLDQGEPARFPDAGSDLQLLTDHGTAPDAATEDSVPRSDLGPCTVTVPAGTYRGSVAGGYTGTITFKLSASAQGLTFVDQGSEMVVDKTGGKVTFPLLLGSLACGVLHAALGRPPGTTGGTDLRGAIDGTFKAPDTFKGTWNLPGSVTGTFKASLVP
jgi:hypothetical protein